ncbi:MAG TPA: PQQ-dependent sugar dehydrogenase [Acidimicrobiales bacterium]|nr:PQQ-dependent sugar dehydrogenase [Acidimicrobiales bacterium]
MNIRRTFTMLTSLALALGVLIIPSPPPAAAVNPTLHIAPVLTGLDHAWDVGFASDGTMLVTERPGRLWIRPVNGTFHPLFVDLSDLWVSGETGFMSVEADPLYTSNHRIYTCQGTTDFSNTVQVVAWQVNSANTGAVRVNDPLVGGIDGQFGRHGGCQMRVDTGGALIIGTGDAALGTNPQNPHSLAGKTLRVDRFTGNGLPGNPFFGNAAAGDPRIETLGHRNVQGLALQPGTGIVWSTEHGPDRDDEINQLINGKNYGWNPVNGDPAGYNESVPMTDHAIPNVQDAAWASGIPTLATSGATFLQGNAWGAWQGALAVSTLKGSALQIFSVNASTNTATIIATPPELNGTVGRIRGAELGPSGILYVTTDNGGSDQVLAVSPRFDKDGPAVASSANNRIDQTARGFDQAVWERHSTGSFTAWNSLGGITTSDPDEAAWPGHLDVVVRGQDGAVWDKAATSGTFGPWTTLGGQVTSGPAATSWGTGRTDVFARGIDGALWANAFVTNHWVGWYPLGGQLMASPDVASRAVNRLDVFAAGSDGAFWHRAWTGSVWTPWEPLGGRFTSGPGSVAANGTRMDVFGRGTDGSLWANTFLGTAWSGWYTLGGLVASDPDAVSKSPGTEDVFVRGVDGEQWRRSFDGSRWSAWTQVL